MRAALEVGAASSTETILVINPSSERATTKSDFVMPTEEERP
jgi:hypothetical protein